MAAAAPSVTARTSDAAPPRDRRADRLRSLHLVEIPWLRLVGNVLLSLAVLAHNNLVFGDPGHALAFAIVSMTYAIAAGLLLQVLHYRVTRFDPAIIFLAADLPLWALAVYVTGAERSWLFFVMVLRAADQTITTLRRAVIFAHLASLMYPAVIVYVVLVEGRPVPLASELAKTLLIYAACLYVSLIARSGERQRKKRSEAQRLAADLIAQLEANARMLEAARQRAELASRGKGEFLANITHELRTPLAGIIGLSQLALESDGPAQREHLRRMKIQAESLLASINDILDYSKMDAGRLELERIPFSLRSLVDDVLDAVLPAAEDKTLELTRRVEDDVPDRVIGDPFRLRQVLLNLVGNGVKFTERGNVNVRVRLADQGETTLTLHVEVTDSGIGIPPEKQQAVFEAFTQADGSTTRKYGGTGLGLSIASKLVSLMDGRLWLESEPGHGSRFHFTVVLTKHPAAQPDVVAVAIESGDAAQRAAARAKCVLMADDSPLHRELLSHLLRARGYEVLTAANGREAVEAFKAARIDAVILDWQMPEMDGLQTAQAIRRAERGGNARVPIIAATAAVRPEDRTRGIAAGVDCFLTKPIPTGTLLAILESGPVTGVAPGVGVETGRKELLTRFGDADLARRMIDLFLGEGPRLLGELRAALDRKDPSGFRRTAHALLGAIANFPSVEARDVAAQMERHGLAGDFESAERLFPELQEAVRQLALQLPALF